MPEAVDTLDGDLERIVIERTPEGNAEELGLTEGRKKEVSNDTSGPSGTPVDREDRLAAKTEELYVLSVSET
jgi:hypothetical protein